MNARQDNVTLPRHIVNRIMAHVQKSPEAEVCGLIAMRDGIVTRSIPIPNLAEDIQHRYRMDPAAPIEAMRTIRTQGESLFAIYHSHPSSQAQPSATDIAEAAYPDCLYLIISLNTKGVLEMRGFRIHKGYSREIAIALEH